MIIGMKQSTLQQHKEVAMLCEERKNIAKANNRLLVPQNVKQVVAPKTQGNTRKTNKYYTNCEMTNHNVETCRKKKEQTVMLAQHNQKPLKTSSYACHICGLNGHKMTDYPKFTKMQKMFHGKFVV